MNTAYLGIDASKGYADFALIDQHLNLIGKVVQFDDTYTGHQKCREWLKKCIKTHQITRIRAGIESTGGLENNWLAGFRKNPFHQADFKAIRVNPAAVKFSGKANLSTVTTDAQSAEFIAQYLARYQHSLNFDQPENPFLPYKKMVTQLNQLTKINVACKNLLRQLLHEIFPELSSFCPSGLPNWLFELLKKYPSIGQIARLKPAKLANIAGITPERAEKLIHAARHSVGAFDSQESEMMLRIQIQQIQQLDSQIKQLKSYLEKHVSGPQIDLLKSIPGIGVYSATVLMCYIGEVSYFASPKALASYFGLNPVIRQSGDKKAKSVMSKKGASQVRAVLYMCALSSIKSNGYLKSIFLRHRANGKTARQAIGIIMHKLIRLVWGVLNSKKPFDSAVDQKNATKTVTVKSTELQEILNKRNGLDFDPLAPVSARTQRKRKEHLLSQAVENGQVRDLESAPNWKET